MDLDIILDGFEFNLDLCLRSYISRWGSIIITVAETSFRFSVVCSSFAFKIAFFESGRDTSHE